MMAEYPVYIRNLSRMQMLPTMPGMDRGQHLSPQARASKLRQTCDECLWNWENVHTGKGRVCYHNTSPRYHQQAGGAACFAFENRVTEEELAALGRGEVK